MNEPTLKDIALYVDGKPWTQAELEDYIRRIAKKEAQNVFDNMLTDAACQQQQRY